MLTVVLQELEENQNGDESAIDYKTKNYFKICQLICFDISYLTQQIQAYVQDKQRRNLQSIQNSFIDTNIDMLKIKYLTLHSC